MDDAGQTSTFRLALESFFVFAAAFAIYVALPTQNYYWDGLIYGEFLEQADSFGPALFHPNHLIYNFAGYAAYALLGSIADRALFALQYLSILFGAASVASFYLICRRLFESRYLGVVATALFAFSAAWWRFATDANVYVITIFFLLLSFYSLIADRPRTVVASLAFFVAMLFHELAILFLPAACLAIWQRDDEVSRLREVVKFSLTSGVLIVISYVAAFRSLKSQFQSSEFVSWLTSYAGAATMGPNASNSFSWLFKGTRQLFVDGSTNLVQPGPVSVTALILFGSCVLVLIISVIIFRTSIYRALSDRGIFQDQNRRLLILCLAWILPYAGFLLLFEPQNTFYRLFYLPPMIVAIGAFLATFRRETGTHYVRALLVLVFALYNFAFYIYPNSQARAGSLMALTQNVEKVWGNDALVVFDPQRPTEGVIRTVKYFNRAAEWRDVDMLTNDAIRNEFPDRYARGGAIWFERNAFEKVVNDSMRREVINALWTVETNATASAPKENLEFLKLAPRGANDSTK